MPSPASRPWPAACAADAAPHRRSATGLVLATLLVATLGQGCGLRRALHGPDAGTDTGAGTTAAPARDYGTTQEGSLTVRGGLPPRAGDVPAGAAMPPVPPRPPLEAVSEAPAEAIPAPAPDLGGTAPPAAVSIAPPPPPPPGATTETTITTVVSEGAPPVAAGLVAGAVRPQSATGAFTGGRGGCEALAAATLAREGRLDFTTPPAELLALGGMHLELARCARGAGDAALARARARHAAVILARADALEISTGNLAGLADTRSQLAHAAYEAGEYPEARRLLRDAIARYSALGRTAEAHRDLRLLTLLGPGPVAGA